MADESEKNLKMELENDGESDKERTLADFVLNQYEKQKQEGKMEETDDISDDRRDSFFARALGECQRMSGETNKSQSKVAALHSELGGDRFTAWRNEHAAEVLLPHQAEAIAIASQQNMDSYYAEQANSQS